MTSSEEKKEKMTEQIKGIETGGNGEKTVSLKKIYWKKALVAN